jgi:hypothetical protein
MLLVYLLTVSPYFSKYQIVASITVSSSKMSDIFWLWLLYMLDVHDKIIVYTKFVLFPRKKGAGTQIWGGDFLSFL